MLNEHQTELRNQLRSSAAMAFDKIASQLRAETLQGQQKLYDNIMKLKNILDSTKGKKCTNFSSLKLRLLLTALHSRFAETRIYSHYMNNGVIVKKIV